MFLFVSVSVIPVLSVSNSDSIDEFREYNTKHQKKENKTM